MRGLHGLRNSVVKATLGAGSHPLPGLAGEAGASGASLGSPSTISAPALGPSETILTTAFTGP